MKKILLLILVILSVSIYSCQKDSVTAPKKTLNGTLSKNGRDTVPPSLLRFKAPAAQIRDTVPPAK